MTYSFFASALMGLLHVAVPSYGLRLTRQFGSRQVGWALVAAFLGLALLNLVGGIGAVGNTIEHGTVRTLVGAVIPLLLLIGMAHVETLFREAARIERTQRARQGELEQFLERRTEELAEVQEEFHRELSRRDHQARVFAQRAEGERLDLATQVAARAGQQLNRIGTTIELYAKVLLERPSDIGSTQYQWQLLARAGEARELAHKLLACGSCAPLRPQLVSLSELVRRHTPLLRRFLSGDQVLECSYGNDAALVWADPHLVRWMLEELVRNARNAMFGAGRVRIGIEKGDLNQPQAGVDPARSQFWAIVVADTGSGMSRDVQRHLGEPFFAARGSQGPGLGLASASGLMKEHGGWLTVTSAAGHGTEVRLCFPRPVQLKQSREAENALQDRALSESQVVRQPSPRSPLG